VRVETIGDATLYLGDCLEILPTLAQAGILEQSETVTVTDPPYGINHSSNHGASWQRTQIRNDESTATRDAALEGFENVAAFGTWKTPPITDCKATLVWDKGPAFGMGDLSFPWKPSFELVYVRGSLWSGRRDEGVLRGEVQVSWESKGRVHPHQKPPGIIAMILEKLPRSSTILDPFMGSGTTGVACANLGRKFIGIEIEPKYYDIACRRISDAYKQPRLFDDPKPEPVQTRLDLTTAEVEAERADNG
jgi:DNA modification methylase